MARESTCRFAVLGMLCRGPMSGYDLRAAIERGDTQEILRSNLVMQLLQDPQFVARLGAAAQASEPDAAPAAQDKPQAVKPRNPPPSRAPPAGSERTPDPR